MHPCRLSRGRPIADKLFLQSNDQTVHVWDTYTGTNLHLFQDKSDAVRVVAWSSDGSSIATAGMDAHVRVWDVTTNGLIVTYGGHAGDAVNTMAWSPTQLLLAFTGNDDWVHVWDAASGQPVTIYRGHAGNVYAMAWSFDGKRIVSGGSDA